MHEATENRWSRRTLFSTAKFSVEERTLAASSEGLRTRHVVLHPGAVVILPVLDEDRIVMIRNFRHAAETELLELPAGTREYGESPEQTAHRELIEETGYQAGLLEPFQTFFTSPGVMTEFMHAFIAVDLKFVGQRLESGEQIRTEVVSVATIRQALVRGELRDGKSIAVIGAYLLRAGR